MQSLLNCLCTQNPPNNNDKKKKKKKKKKSVLILVSNRTILKTVSFEPLIIIPAQTIDLQAVSWPGEFC